MTMSVEPTRRYTRAGHLKVLESCATVLELKRP
jgi:hypothetical protein